MTDIRRRLDMRKLAETGSSKVLESITLQAHPLSFLEIASKCSHHSTARFKAEPIRLNQPSHETLAYNERRCQVVADRKSKHLHLGSRRQPLTLTPHGSPRLSFRHGWLISFSPMRGMAYKIRPLPSLQHGVLSPEVCAGASGVACTRALPF